MVEIERPRKRREDTLTVRIDAADRMAAEAAAKKAGVTLSDIVRAGIRNATRSVLEAGE